MIILMSVTVSCVQYFEVFVIIIGYYRNTARGQQ